MQPAPDPPTLCNKAFGGKKGLGGVQRRCRRPAGHTGRCHDMPFLDHLWTDHRPVADKIIRDSFQTRGASWGADREGNQKRKNRQPRWTVTEGHPFYPAHSQTYENCLPVAAELATQAYEMYEAPTCPPAVAALLPRVPVPNTACCLICRGPLLFSEFDLAEESKAAIDTDHLNPGLERRHASGNVAFVHHICNTTKGDRSLEEFEDWMVRAMRQRGYTVTKPS